MVSFDNPGGFELAEALARTVEIDDDTARSIVLALDGASAPHEFELHEDTFRRQLRRRPEQAYIRRAE